RRLVVGRAASCEICIDFDLISRHHAEIIHGPLGGWWVHDLGSRNGIKVNGIKTLQQNVGPGDTIRIGKFNLRLLPADPPAPSAPRPQTPSGPVFDAAGPRPFHISRTLLRALRHQAKPVIGSNARHSSDVVQLSLDTKVMPLAGVACPLNDAADEVLYVCLPP